MRFDQERAERRKERIETEAGDIWIWEMDAGDTARVTEYATRPEFDPRGGIDLLEAINWQLALSCYHGPEEGAERIWPDEKVHRIREMPNRLFSQIMREWKRVHGQGEAEIRAVRDFTPAAGAPTASE